MGVLSQPTDRPHTCYVNVARSPKADLNSETPAQKRAREILEKEDAKNASERRRTLEKTANKVLAQCGPAIAAFKQVLGRQGIDLVASPLVEPVKDAVAFLQDSVQIAESALAGGDVDVTKLPDTKVTAVKIATGKKAINLVTGMMASIAKMGSVA